MIGDIDPIKAARRGHDISDELTVHYGLLPRANRGIFAINELPDLAGKIQVGLFNIMQEGDVQIKGYPVRLPLDLLLVFTANPEDYTARGKIITPLKDRIGSEIRTHYPASLEQGIDDHGAGSLAERPSPIETAVPALHPRDRRAAGVSGARGQAGRQALRRLPAAADLGAGKRGLERRAAGAALRGAGGRAARAGYLRGAALHHRQARAGIRRRAEGRRRGGARADPHLRWARSTTSTSRERMSGRSCSGSSWAVR